VVRSHDSVMLGGHSNDVQKSGGAGRMSTFKMYMILVRASIQSRMQYKFNFVMSSVMAAMIWVIEFLMIAVVMLKFGSIKGWSLAEMAYLYSVLILSRSIYRMFASDVHHLEKYLVTGDLDQLLTRPLPVLMALMTQNVHILFGEIVQGVAILAISMNMMLQSGQITIWAIPLTLVVIVSGALILFAIGLFTATLGFWITRISDLQNVTEDASRFAASYPLVLYPKWLKYSLLTIVPVGFANYIPALYILRGELGGWIIASTLIFAIGFLYLGLKFWKIGISRYQSTGS
jgi:ABC-2 type transport system permease protein